jgi:uncharacterized membrane-anchored protein YhcB (DUF1043 family)
MKKIILIIIAVGLMLAYVWMRLVSNRMAERVADLEQRTQILAEKLDREKIELSRELLVVNLEPKAKALGLYYPWEQDGKN